MSGQNPTPPPEETPAIGFIGWGPDSQALLEALQARLPGALERAAALAGHGAPQSLRAVPTVEELLGRCELVFAEGGEGFLAQYMAALRLAISDKNRLVLLGGGWRLENVLEVLKERKLARCLVLPAPRGWPPLLAYLISSHFSGGERAGFQALAGALGEPVELKDEAHFEVARGLADFTPAALYTILEALADGVVMLGFPRAAALQYLASLLAATATRMQDGRTPPGQLREQALSVDVAAAGLIELESAGVRGMMMRAIQQAVRHAAPAKTKELQD